MSVPEEKLKFESFITALNKKEYVQIGLNFNVRVHDRGASLG